MDITITSYSFADGMTLHTAFQFEFFDEHVGLGHKKLAEYREDLKHLELIIVDEMSLMTVSYTHLTLPTIYSV